MKPSVVPQVASPPAPPAPPAVKESEAWDPELMEQPKESYAVPTNVTDKAFALAEDYDVELARVVGTGKDGRILVGDVRAAID